jgi:hypothetical protein
MNEFSVAVLVPVLDRPKRIVPLVRNIVEVTPKPQVILLPSPGHSDVMLACEEATDLDSGVMVRVYHDECPQVGNYAKKINWALQFVRSPFVFTGADDLLFHPDWFAHAVREMEGPIVGVVGTNDLGHPRVYDLHETSTHSLFRMSYVMTYGGFDERGGNDPGKILYEGYVHEFVDDEVVGIAKSRGAWRVAPLSMVEHMHPVWGKGEWDETYNDQGRRMNASRGHFAQRCPLWGGKPI